MNKKHYKTTLLLAAFLLVFSAVFAQQAYAGDGLFSGFKRFGKHTYAGPFDISKKNRKKAKEKLVQDFAELEQTADVQLILQDQQVSVSSEAIRFDADATIAQAVSGEDNPLIAVVSREGLRTVLSQNFKQLSFTKEQIEILAGQMEKQLDRGIMPQYMNVADFVPELYEQSVELASASFETASLTSGLIGLIEALDGYTIEPNSSFSLREFVSEHSIAGTTDHDLTIIASLLYKDALQTNWAVDERSIANELTKGIEPGFEAAVNRSLGLDFIFSNLNKTAFTLRAGWSGGRITIAVEGLPFLRSYEPYAVRVEGYDPRSIVRFSAFVPAGKTQLVDSGKKGLEITTGRNIRLNGTLDDFEPIAVDFYAPHAGVARRSLEEDNSSNTGNEPGAGSNTGSGTNSSGSGSSGTNSGTDSGTDSGGSSGNSGNNSNSPGKDSNTQGGSSGAGSNGGSGNKPGKPDGKQYGYDKGGNVVELDKDGLPID